MSALPQPPVTPATAADYRVCRRLNARHGKTFYLATALLTPQRRPAVHALYGFARYVDDLVDEPVPGSRPADRLAAVRRQVATALQTGDEPEVGTGPGDAAPEPPPEQAAVVRALADTVRRYDIDGRLVLAFLDSMSSDLTVDRYADFDQLRGYMWGSASVIGLQVLPVLGVVGERLEAERAASDLGIAFQLTNFARDVGEDFRRGRIYLPQTTLVRHGVTESMFTAAVTPPALRRAVRDEIDRAADFYRAAAAGIPLLCKESRDCVWTAHRLYGEILDRIRASDYDVLSGRARVPLPRRITVGARGYVHARRSRRPGRPPAEPDPA